MAACPRRDIVREGEIGVYHTWSRCVQQAFLCGVDPQTGTDFSYRRGWIEELIRYQAGVFAVDVGNFSILSNHMHLIVRTRPDIVFGWSDEEVATRWKLAWPDFAGGRWHREPDDAAIREILDDPPRLERIRKALSSLSWFMARVKEPISKAANVEAEKSGHFWSERFGSRELLDDRANLTCMTYLDLNQFRAGLAPSLEQSAHSAIAVRIAALRRAEAEDSVDSFHEKRSKIHAFTVEEAERLLAGSYLAPITARGPLLTQEQVAAIERAREHNALAAEPEDVLEKLNAPLQVRAPGPAAAAARVDEDEATETSSGPSAEDGEDGEDAADAPATEPESSQKAEPVVSPAAGPRPGDEDFTLAPVKKRKKTYHILQRVFPDGVPARNSDVAILNMPLSQYLDIVQWAAEAVLAEKRAPPPQAFEETDLDPDTWLAAVEHFDTRFHHAVGSAARLEEISARNNRGSMHGIRHCRDTFG